MGSNFAITLLGHGRPLQGDDSCDMTVLTAPAAPRPPGLLSPLLLASGGDVIGSPSPGRHRCACPYSGTETICGTVPLLATIADGRRSGV